jgi:hypothetical protein
MNKKFSRDCFVVIETNKYGSRYWIWDNNLDAETFKARMEKRFTENSYKIQRANVAEL